MDDSKQLAWLVLKAQSGDRRSLDQLLRAVQVSLFRYIQRITVDDALAEDVLQDVMVRIYRRLGTLSEPRAFRSWALRIASREAVRRVVRRRGRERLMERDDVLANLPSPIPDVEPDPVEARRLAESVGALPPASRAVLALHYLEGLSIREAADVLGIAVGTAKSRIAYGLEALRRQMGVERHPGGSNAT